MSQAFPVNLKNDGEAAERVFKATNLKPHLLYAFLPGKAKHPADALSGFRTRQEQCFGRIAGVRRVWTILLNCTTN